jgi:hypothetical protein
MSIFIRDGQSLLEETLIVSNSEVNNHAKDIDTQYEPVWISLFN